MKSGSSKQFALLRLVISAVAIIALVVVSLPLKLPPPASRPARVDLLATVVASLATPLSSAGRWIASLAVVTGNTASYLACILALFLCWRQSENRPALYLAAFLAHFVLCAALYSKSAGFLLPAAWDAERVVPPAALAFSILAAFFWIRFCRGFPREFSSLELPTYYGTGEPLGLLSARRMAPAPPKGFGLMGSIFGRSPARYIDSERAESIILLFGGAFVAFAIARMMAGGPPADRVYIPPYFIFMLIGLGTDMLRQHYYLSRDVERQKILWVVEGTLLGFTFVPLAGVMTAFGFAFSPLRDAAAAVFVLAAVLGFLCFVVCVAVAIFKEGALDPALVLKKTVLFSILTGFIVVSYLLFVGGVGSLVMRFTAIQNQSVIIFSTLAIAALFQPVRARAQVFVDRRLFRKKYEYPELLEAIRREIKAGSEAAGHLQELAERLKSILSTDSVVIFTKSSQTGVLTAAASSGAVKGVDGLSLGAASSLRELPEACHVSHRLVSPADRETLKQISAALLVPAIWSGRTVGVLSLGPRLTGGSYDAEDIEFLSAVMNHSASALAQQEIQKERRDLEQALEIQQGLLPREIPEVYGLDISGVWLPARTVSGDYYDVFKIGDSGVAVCIGDVSGKGMPAALLMANVQAVVRSIAPEGLPPSAVCRKVNQVLLGNVAPGRFITFFYAVIDTLSKRMMYTCAGHNPPILIREDGTSVHLEGGGMVLGLFAEATFEEKHIELSPGDRLILFTDGVSEAVSPAGEEFGEERLIEVAQQHSGAAADLQRAIITAVSEHSRGNFHDDVTLVIIRASR